MPRRSHLEACAHLLMLAAGLMLSGAIAEAGAPAIAATEQDYLNKIETWFVKGALARPPKVVDCTLSGGTKARCVALTTNIDAVGFPQGPWCPRQITDGSDKSGIWLRDGKVHAADGPFVANLKLF